jgi:hypothetical protein
VTNPIVQLVPILEEILVGDHREFQANLAGWMQDTDSIDDDFKDNFLGALMGFIMAYKFAETVGDTDRIKETVYLMAEYYGREAFQTQDGNYSNEV